MNRSEEVDRSGVAEVYPPPYGIHPDLEGIFEWVGEYADGRSTIPIHSI
jgi:hypothetical protein